MLTQLLLGGALIVATIMIAGTGFILMEFVLMRCRRWLLRPPHKPKLLLLLVASVVWILVIATAGVWLWALAMLWLDLFVTLEAAVYFALVAFTTLGFGDLLLPDQWRLLSGMAAINGLMMIGLQTAFLIEVVRVVRQSQATQDWNGG